MSETSETTIDTHAAPENERSAWRRQRGEPSLAEVFRSIHINKSGGTLRRVMAFVGPGYLVAVGYMDPGNWATSIAGGAQFGYALLAVALMSNIMAIILQSLCARLAIGLGRDLAQACRDAFSKPVALILWLFAEIAIIATDTLPKSSVPPSASISCSAFRWSSALSSPPLMSSSSSGCNAWGSAGSRPSS